MRISTIFTSMLLVLLMNSLILSQSVRESFEYPLGTVLDTLGGEAGNGWAGGWDSFADDVTSLVVADTGIEYDLINYEIPNVGNNGSSIHAVQWMSNRFRRPLAEEWPDQAGNIYWLSFIMELRNFSDAGGAIQSWAGIGLYNDSTEGPLFGKGWGDGHYSIGSDDGVGKTDYMWDAGPLWLVVRMDMSGDTTDERMFMWVSPDPAGDEPDTNLADTKRDIGMNDGFNTIVYHYGGAYVSGVLSIDEIRLGTTWEDVSSDIEVGVRKLDNIQPAKYSISQNYPNPFNPRTNIHFSIPEAGLVTLKVYNLMGQEITTLINEYKNIGNYNVDFDAASTESALPSGIYFYKINAGSYSETKKMILIK